MVQKYVISSRLPMIKPAFRAQYIIADITGDVRDILLSSLQGGGRLQYIVATSYI